MTRGAYRGIATPDGRLIRKDGADDGRYRKRKTRETPWYVRLSPEWFALLESLLDNPCNIQAGTAIPGCHSRADLIEFACKVYLRVNDLAHDFTHDKVDVADRLIEAMRPEVHNVAIPTSLNAATPPALSASRNSNSS